MNNASEETRTGWFIARSDRYGWFWFLMDDGVVVKRAQRTFAFLTDAHQDAKENGCTDGPHLTTVLPPDIR